MEDENKGAIDSIRSPERPSFMSDCHGLQARFLIGGEALNPKNTSLPSVTKESIVEFGKRNYHAFENASKRERETFWKQKHPGMEYQEQLRTWIVSTTEIFNSEQGKQKLSSIAPLLSILGLNHQSISQEDISRLYNRYFSPSSQQGDQDTSGVKRFIKDVFDAYTKDGKVDTVAIRNAIESIGWFAHIFGETSSEVIAQLLDAEAKITNEEEKNKLIEIVNTKTGNEENSPLRINNLTDYEIKLLSFVYENKGIEDDSQTQTTQNGNTSATTGSTNAQNQPQYSSQVYFRPQENPREFPNKEYAHQALDPQFLAKTILERDQSLKARGLTEEQIQRQIETEQAALAAWLHNKGLTNERLSQLITNAVNNYTEFIAKKYGITIPRLGNIPVLPLFGLSSKVYNPSGEAFAFVRPDTPAIFIDFERVIKQAKVNQLNDLFSGFSHDQIEQYIINLLLEINPHEYTHLTSDIAYWNTRKVEGINPDDIPMQFVLGKVGTETAKFKTIPSQDGTQIAYLSRGQGLMEAITVELTNQWAKSMNAQLDIPAYAQERRVLHAICQKIAQEDGVRAHDVFTWFVQGYYSPEGYRKMVEKLSGHEGGTSKRPHYFQIILGLMKFDETIAASSHTTCEYPITLQYITDPKNMPDNMKKMILENIQKPEFSSILQLSPSAIKTIQESLGGVVPTQTTSNDHDTTPTIPSQETTPQTPPQQQPQPQRQSFFNRIFRRKNKSEST